MTKDRPTFESFCFNRMKVSIFFCKRIGSIQEDYEICTWTPIVCKSLVKLRRRSGTREYA